MISIESNHAKDFLTDSLISSGKLKIIKVIKGKSIYPVFLNDRIIRIILLRRNGVLEEIEPISGKRLIVINAAGSWLNDVSRYFEIELPVKSCIGIQAKISNQYIFESNILTFGPDGKYIIISPQKDHTQIGPTNTDFHGSIDDLSEDCKNKAIRYLRTGINDIIDEECSIKESEIGFKSAGLRIKVDLRYVRMEIGRSYSGAITMIRLIILLFIQAKPLFF